MHQRLKVAYAGDDKSEVVGSNPTPRTIPFNGGVMDYQRVIPRDLFNESKLLKCLGQLALIIHDGVDVHEDLNLEHDQEEFLGFNIDKDESDGGLYVSNLILTIENDVIMVYTPYNSKDPYPLVFVKCDGVGEGKVFTDEGKLSQEFKDWLNYTYW